MSKFDYYTDADWKEEFRDCPENREIQTMTDREIATELRKTMGCNCDLDNWESEVSTGHSWVCRIHQKVKAIRRGDAPMPDNLRGNDE